ncbi:MAG: ribbon-helix-helix protein, CopG family [Chloroflexi bacterium]|nr:ribbon-helix-helix protein, CopG family [Chloroflexota bacterium]
MAETRYHAATPEIKDSCFSLPPEMFEQVQRVKDEEGRDMSELVREALRLYMEDRELRWEQRRERLRSQQANQSEEDDQGGHSNE